MNRILAFGRTVGVSFGLVMVGAIAAFSVLAPPSVQGPYLGDTSFPGNPGVNFYTLWNAISSDNQIAYQTVTGISTTVGQTTCTQIGNTPIAGQAPQPAVLYLSTVATAATGAVCLPTAFAGRELYIYNNTGQTINLYASSTSVIGGGTLDTINTVAGATAFAVPQATATIGAAGAGVVNCISTPAAAAGVAPTGLAVNGGAWACQRGN